MNEATTTTATVTLEFETAYEALAKGHDDGQRLFVHEGDKECSTIYVLAKTHGKARDALVSYLGLGTLSPMSLTDANLGFLTLQRTKAANQPS